MVRRKPENPTSLTEIGHRLALTRQALGYTQATMGKLMGASAGGQAFQNYEAGRRRISIGHATKLCQTCGMSMDWIYLGHMHSLPPELRDKILEHVAPRGPYQTTLKSRSR